MTFKKAYIEPIIGGRQLLIGDIHGCYFTFIRLLEKIDLQINDQLIIIGDVLNKGPNAKGVIDKLIELRESGHTVFVIRGNNESLVLKVLKKNEYRIERLAVRFGIIDLFKSDKWELKKKYRSFLKDTLYYIESPGFFAVHAGFDFSSYDPFNDTFQMLWMRNFTENAELQKNKPVIFGHRIYPYSKIKKSVRKEKLSLPIDNGCVLGNEDKKFGRLVCLDFTNNILFKQRNIEDVVSEEIESSSE